ncbi:hypothetical protein FO519_004724 [Halicephalobus sp. NKZ332]|nr:hypothetical protein FO519_004724 [Halicephalobus sp. NKZ332]
MNMKRPHDETPKSDRRPKKAVKGTTSELPPLPPMAYTRPKAIISDANGILSPRHDIGKRKGRKSVSKADSEEFRRKQCQTLLQRIEDNIVSERRNVGIYQKLIQEFSHRRSALKTSFENIQGSEDGVSIDANLDPSRLSTVKYTDELFSLLTTSFNDGDQLEVDSDVFSKLTLAEKANADNKSMLNMLQSNITDSLTRAQRQSDILNNFIR